MQRTFAIVVAALICGAGLPAATTQPKKPAPKTVQQKSVSKKTAAVRRTPHKATAHAKTKTAARPVSAAWHPGQTAPTPDRYKEIQEALAKKGYLHGEPDGVWNQDSADALRRFQQDQNLQASGKLDSLSIIALGLGPKH